MQFTVVVTDGEAVDLDEEDDDEEDKEMSSRVPQRATTSSQSGAARRGVLCHPNNDEATRARSRNEGIGEDDEGREGEYD